SFSEPMESSAAKFARLRTAWRRETAHLSKMKDLAMAKSYQAIIGMGKPALPLIMEELRIRPHWWFWALEMITEANPVKPEHRGHLMNMREDWLAWWDQENQTTTRILA